jgi:antitoxin HicB
MYRVPLVFTPQPEGGNTVTSPVLPEFFTAGDTLEEAHANVRGALDAVIELDSDSGGLLPLSISLPAPGVSSGPKLSSEDNGFELKT